MKRIIPLLFLAAVLPAQPGGLAAECRRHAEPVWRKTVAHPFLAALSDGTLPREKFRFYLEQDLLYLREFSRVLLELAARAPHPGHARTLARHASEAIAGEAALHASILGLDGKQRPGEPLPFRVAPSNLAYVNHLRAAARGTFLEGMAAVLPCYWIHLDAGKSLAEKGSPVAEYQQWITQYAGPDYEKSVREALEIFNEAAAAASPGVRALALEAFERSARYEWMFWEMAWRLEAWPPQ